MANWKKLAQGAAGAAGAGEALNVEDVFSTYLYTGTGSSLGISNGIALGDGVGGGTSTEFDGSSDYLERSFSESTRTQMTFSAWIYPEYNTSGKTYFRNGATTAPYEFNIQVGSDSNLDFYLITGNQSKSAIGTNKTLGFNSWHHILFSINTSTGVAQLYIDDVSVGVSNTSSGEDLKPLLNSFQIMKGEGSGKAEGKVAHVFLDYTYRDLSTTSNRRLFIDANGGSTSPSTLSALSPILYLPMTDAYSVGENIGTGGDFTAYGSPTVVDSGTEYLSGVGQGGLVWIKNRTDAFSHYLTDTERGTNSQLSSDLTSAAATSSVRVTGFNADGFNLGGNGATNGSSDDMASWTFRKAPKFFDCVTYTGTGSNQTISHNLGSTPGMIIVKAYSGTGGWIVYDRSNGATKFMYLNSDGTVQTSSLAWNNTAPTSTEFTVGTLGGVNVSGRNYVAYLFAHNDGDGEFGPTGDQDIIKCGSYTGTGAAGNDIDLGFEPQWILIKGADYGTNWQIYDNMRGVVTGGNDAVLYPNTAGAENNLGDVDFNATGFTPASGSFNSNYSGKTYIYMAIRRGPMAVPESATDVFAIDTRYSQNSLPSWQSGFVTDLAISKRTTGSDTYVYDRLRQGKELAANASSSEASASQRNFDHMDGWGEITSASSTEYSWMWKRAPNYFDVVAYTGNGTAGRTVSHNLGVAPEMMWVKGRSIAQNWAVYNPNGRLQLLNQTGAEYSAAVTDDYFGNGSSVIAPTETEFTLGAASPVNNSGDTYIAYLFASLDGISKVGSFSHTNNTTTNVDCGFSSGARFVMIKLSDGSDSWYVWDTTRGINAGTEPLLRLNTNGAEITTNDWIDPLSSGFQITGPDLLTGTYIFYAIA